MKRIVVLFLTFVMLLSCTACGRDAKSGDKDTVSDGNNSMTNDDLEKEKSTDVTISIDSVKKAKETNADLFECEEVEGGVSIIGFSGTDEIVVIPESIGGQTVVSIGERAFDKNTTIRGLKLSDTVRIIGESAFMNCSELEVFVSGSSLKKLESYSFNMCTKLRDVELNYGLESMINCFNLADISEIEIPSSVVEMFVPFSVPTPDYYITIIGESGSYVEQYVKENGEEYHLKFQAK